MSTRKLLSRDTSIAADTAPVTSILVPTSPGMTGQVLSPLVRVIALVLGFFDQSRERGRGLIARETAHGWPETVTPACTLL